MHCPRFWNDFHENMFMLFVLPKDKKSKKYVEDVSCPNCYDKLTKKKKKKLLIRKQQKSWLKNNLK